MPINKRGRPSKPKYVVQMGVESVLDISERNDLHVALNKLPCFKNIPDGTVRETLETKLEAVICKFRALEIANRERKGPRGNKQKLHVQTLILDCANAWGDVTGVSEVFLWESAVTKKEPPVAEISRLCLAVAYGKPYAQSLRQQFVGAGKLLLLNYAINK